MTDLEIPKRTMIHIDMDAFFAAVELRDHPELRGKPVVIGSQPDQRGVVATASYEARVYGIHSAMPSRTAGKLCPHAIFLPGRMRHYRAVSEQVMDIIRSFTPLVEQVSVDEAFMDVRGVLRKWGSAVRVGEALRKRIRDDVGLTASVGVATNKFLAKLASDLEKPDGLTVVPEDPDEILAFLAPLPVSRLWGVGKKSEARLLNVGLKTVGDLQQHSLEEVQSLLGESMGAHVHALAFGEDERDIVTEREAKSISSEHTFDVDVINVEVHRQILIEQAETVGRRLRRKEVLADTVQIKFRFEDFSTYTRQRKLDPPTSSDRELIDAALGLYEQQEMNRPVRLLGFGTSGLETRGTRYAQVSLFEEDDRSHDRERDERLDDAVDKIRKTYGDDALHRGNPSQE